MLVAQTLRSQGIREVHTMRKGVENAGDWEEAAGNKELRRMTEGTNIFLQFQLTC